MQGPKVSMIAAIGRDRGLGYQGQLLWRIPEDLKRFKALTTGHPVIMGRTTFDSIGRPLPNRTNIVVTRNADWSHEGVTVAHSLEEALEKAREAGPSEIFIIGGAQIYAEALPYSNKLYLTLIDDQKPADVFFPEYKDFTKEVFREEHGAPDGLKYTWVDLEK